MDQKNNIENEQVYRCGSCSYTFGEMNVEGEGSIVEVNVETGNVTRRFPTDDEIKKQEESYRNFLLEEEKQKQRVLQREKIISEVKYEDRIVIFLDILGWGNIVDESAKIENFELLQKIANVAYNAKDMSENLNSEVSDFRFTRVTNFSDSLVISLSINDIYPQRLEFFLHPLIFAALNAGMFIRGGITLGKIYHDNNMVFGPALNRAYKLESAKDKAIYPRIILDDNVVEICSKDRIEFLQKWRKIDDDYYFYDFIYTITTFQYMTESFEKNKIIYKENIELIKNTIERGLKTHFANERVYPKYQWLGKYFNSIFPENKIVFAKTVW